MNIIDIIILIILMTFAVVGWKQGIIKEGVTVIGLIAVFFIAFTFKEEIGNYFCKFFPFIKFKGALTGLVSLNVLIYQMIGFIIIFGVLCGLYQIILTCSGILQKIVNWTIVFTIPSKIGGAIIGLFQGFIIIFIFFLIALYPLNEYKIISESKIPSAIIYKTPILSKYTADISNTINEVYDLINSFRNKKISTNDANLKIIDTMIKYKIVSKKTIEQLIVLEKLETVKGLEAILDKYE